MNIYAVIPKYSHLVEKLQNRSENMTIINDHRKYHDPKDSLNPLQYSGISAFFRRGAKLSDEMWDVTLITLGLLLAPEYITQGDLHIETNRRMLSRESDVNPLIFAIGNYIWGWELGEWDGSKWIDSENTISLSNDAKELLSKVKSFIADYYITDNFQMSPKNFPKNTPERYQHTMIYVYDDTLYFYKPLIHDCSPVQISSRNRLDYIARYHLNLLGILFKDNIASLSQLKLDSLDEFDHSKERTYYRNQKTIDQINKNGIFFQNHKLNHQKCLDNYPQRII